MTTKLCNYCGINEVSGKCKFCSRRCASFAREDARNPEITIGGISKLRKEWESETGIGHNLVDERLKRGWHIEDALLTPAVTPEGKTKDDRYSIYRGMLNRCNNPHCRSYERYGGRGIKVSQRWLGPDGFTNFCNDMGERPSDMSLDRVDNDAGYSKENCRWATAKQQANNTVKTKKLAIGNEIKTLSEWCEIYGIKKPTVESRLRAGWTASEALLVPSRRGTRMPEDDVQKAVCQWLDYHHIKYWHTPNETWTSSWATKMNNKKKGVKAGIPDLTILIPKDTGFFILFMELKTETGAMSKDQKEWQIILSGVDGCEFRCCKGLDEAIGILENMTKNEEMSENKKKLRKISKNDCPF